MPHAIIPMGPPMATRNHLPSFSFNFAMWQTKPRFKRSNLVPGRPLHLAGKAPPRAWVERLGERSGNPAAACGVSTPSTR
jgi:hypothetical protein